MILINDLLNSRIEPESRATFLSIEVTMSTITHMISMILSVVYIDKSFFEYFFIKSGGSFYIRIIDYQFFIIYY
ncbi:MAG: hypothetical protein OEZ01_16535 [Candidatus Heimdallarchaeota archaeon]|nr:hypothetical protein [Candidatus Heimdallarchaeota archaeon]